MIKEIRQCKKHGLVVFYIDSKTRTSHCSKCNSENIVKRRKKLKQMAVDYKGGKCSICGYNKSIRALIFHHLDPTKKDFNIGDAGNRTWEKIKEEIEKCALVCSNCHAEIEDEIEENKINT